MKANGETGGVIHIYDMDKRKDHLLGRLKTHPNKKNAEAIRRFHYQIVSDGLSLSSQVKYLDRLSRLSNLLNKNFEDCERKDLEELFISMSQDSRFTRHAISQYKLAIKRFFQWLKGYRRRKYPPEVDWIEVKTNYRTKINPEDLITEDEALQMIDAADNARDKAFVAMLYEGGCRVGELLDMKIKNINYDDMGAFSMVDGKTGQRRVRFRNSTPLIKSWLEIHPDRKNPDAPLWVVINNTREIYKSGKKLNREGRPYKFNWNYCLKYAPARQMLVRLAKKAGITKRVNPHMFRHSRASLLAKRGVGQSIMCANLGWTQGSKMSGVYIHLNGKDTDDVLMERVYGEKSPEQSIQSKANAVQCYLCREINPPGSARCKRCNALIGDAGKEDLEENSSIVRLASFFKEAMTENSDFEKTMVSRLMKKIEKQMKEKGVI